MKAIIPVAGVGTRLRPHTYSIPKVLMTVAGKPIIGHILDKLEQELHSSLDEIIFIVSQMAEKIEKYIEDAYDLKATYIEQKEQLGLGHAIWLAKEAVKNTPAIIIYGDTIFDAKLIDAVNTDKDACLGVKEVDDPRRFGIVELSASGGVKQLIEKPEHPSSKLALVGVNFIRDTKLMFECIEENIKKKKTTKGEIQFTDAMQLMIDKGAKFNTFTIDEWLDCGTAESMLDTNQKLLKKFQYPESAYTGSTIKSPVFIHSAAKIINSTIGPYVSIDKSVTIKNSIISNSIINENVIIENKTVLNSIVSLEGVTSID